ncbi:MAG: DUF2283 domain-containing protein [Chromatiales bacterium]|nr:DUF2283 domain-containing protein [Chromatiales bacterium]
MKTTRYFDEQVVRKRPYIKPAWCAEVIAAPLRREEQPDGRFRFWGPITVPGENAPRILRVVTLDDGETVHMGVLGVLRSRISGRNAMKLHYYAETDSLYVELKGEPGTETREVSDGLNVDLDAAGHVVGFDIDHASSRLDLSTVEVEALPLRSCKVG